MELITTKEVCAIFKISARTLHYWRKNNGFPEPTINSFPNKYCYHQILEYNEKLKAV